MGESTAPAQPPAWSWPFARLGNSVAYGLAGTTSPYNTDGQTLRGGTRASIIHGRQLMAPKGEACKTCPLWQGGGAMVPDRPGRGAIVVMGQNPGASETAGHWWEGKDRWHEGPVEPFIGASGQMLRRRLLPLLG